MNNMVNQPVSKHHTMNVPMGTKLRPIYSGIRTDKQYSCFDDFICNNATTNQTLTMQSPTLFTQLPWFFSITSSISSIHTEQKMFLHLTLTRY